MQLWNDLFLLWLLKLEPKQLSIKSSNCYEAKCEPGSSDTLPVRVGSDELFWNVDATAHEVNLAEQLTRRDKFRVIGSAWLYF